MVLLTVSDFYGQNHPAVWSADPAEAPSLLGPAREGRLILADWPQASALSALQILAELGPQLLVQEQWQKDLPQAGLLISAAISGGWLAQRFQELADRQCWLTVEPLRHVFPLPCPDGQGQPFLELPEGTVFDSQPLCCRYLHQSDRVFLFDDEETLAQKRLLAKAYGFRGYWTRP